MLKRQIHLYKTSAKYHLFLLVTICSSPYKATATNLVDLQQLIPTIQVELWYATPNNFTKKRIYPEQAKAYLLKPVAQKLAHVQDYLKTKGLGLKIWDAYRPLSAQWGLWEAFPDARYVAPPQKGGRHTRGTTIDLTLVDLKTGNELPMPTGFDDFTEKAHSSYTNLPEQLIQNREILREAMTRFGFVGINSEWWHFDVEDWQEHPVLAIDFEELGSKA